MWNASSRCFSSNLLLFLQLLFLNHRIICLSCFYTVESLWRRLVIVLQHIIYVFSSKLFSCICYVQNAINFDKQKFYKMNIIKILIKTYNPLKKLLTPSSPCVNKFSPLLHKFVKEPKKPLLFGSCFSLLFAHVCPVPPPKIIIR